MKKRSLVISLLVFVVLALLVSACGKADSKEEFKFAYDGVTGKWPYMAKFNKYVHDFATEAGITLVYAESGGDISTQLTTVENFFTQDVDIVSALFMDREGALPVIDWAKEAGNVPVISVLTSIKDEGNGYENYIYVGSKNFDGGYLQGVWLAEHLPQGAGIWLLNSQPGDQQGYDRVDGLKKGLTDNGRTDVTFVADMYAENMKDKGVTIMEDWLNTYDKIDCVVGTNDDSVLGAIESTKAAGRMDEGIIFVGLDGSDPALVSIKAGEMSMSVLQDAYTQAKELVALAVKLRDGADPSTIADIFVPFQAITIDNVDDFIGR
jgi:ABC-type sugar transport system substrate-binding protein